MTQVIDREKLIQLPGGNENTCFGCSQNNHQGLQMVFYATPEADRVYSFLNLAPHFCRWRNFTHGGIIATILDEVMAWGSVVCLGKFVLSKTIFHGPVYHLRYLIDKHIRI